MLVNLHSPARQKPASPLDRGDARRGAGRQGALCVCVCGRVRACAPVVCLCVCVCLCVRARPTPVRACAHTARLREQASGRLPRQAGWTSPRPGDAVGRPPRRFGACAVCLRVFACACAGALVGRRTVRACEARSRPAARRGDPALQLAAQRHHLPGANIDLRWKQAARDMNKPQALVWLPGIDSWPRRVAVIFRFPTRIWHRLHCARRQAVGAEYPTRRHGPSGSRPVQVTAGPRETVTTASRSGHDSVTIRSRPCHDTVTVK